MSGNDIAVGRVIAVLLADGWHRIVPGSFSIGPGLGAGPDLGAPGFRFDEADAGRPYQPTQLAGPLGSIIAVRQVAQAARHLGDRDRAPARYGPRADQVARLRAGTGRVAAQG